ERREAPRRPIDVERHAYARREVILQASEDAGVHGQRHVQRIVLNHRNQLEIEGPLVAGLYRNSHGKADHEVVADRRRLTVGVRDEWEDGSKVSPKPVLRARAERDREHGSSEQGTDDQAEYNTLFHGRCPFTRSVDWASAATCR